MRIAIIIFLTLTALIMLWKFIEVADIHLIGRLEDGVQLFSSTEEPQDASVYIEQIKMKSKNFQN